MKIGLHGKILILIVAGLVIITMAIMLLGYRGYNTVGLQVTRRALTQKLESDLMAARNKYDIAFGSLHIIDGELYDQNEMRIGENHLFVDAILEEHATTATIFARRGNDFMRMTTNIRKADGSRAVGTMLGTDSAAYDTVMSGETYFGTAVILGLSYLTAYDPLFDVNGEIIGILYLGIPEDEILAMVATVARTNISREAYVSTSILVVIALITMFVLGRIFKPIRHITENLHEIASGEADLTKRIDNVSNDEIGYVAEAFNSFVQKLQDLMVQVNSAITTTDEIRHSINAATGDASSAIEEISANLGSINYQLDSLEHSIDGTARVIENITQNINSVDAQITTQSSMVDRSTESLGVMISTLSELAALARTRQESTTVLASVAEEGNDKIETTAAAFKTVVAQIQQIQEMASSINDIASQTNLLSMNAAIEAAHAGDAGRGFAVVAEEIRKLADSAGNSSRSITEIISGISESVHEADRNVIETSDAFKRISTEVKLVVSSFSDIDEGLAKVDTDGKGILDASYEINNMTSAIKNRSTEITQGTAKLVSNSRDIQEVSRIVSSGMDEANTGASEIVRAMQDLLELSHKLTTIVSELKQHFGQFKTE